MRIVLQPNVETGAIESKSEAVFLELGLSVEYRQIVFLIKLQVIASYRARFDARFMQSGTSR
jgi:hypothetical protein